MSVDLLRDILNYEKLIGEGTSQTMVNGDIMLTDRNPDIEKILNVDGGVTILSSEVIDDRVIVEGKMNFDIFYSSNDENKGIYKVNAVSNFTHNIQIPGAKSKMPCKVVTNVEHMEHEIATNRKVKVNAIINIKGMAYDRETVEAITDIKGEEVQLLKDAAEVDEFINESNAQSIIKGKVELPEDKAEVNSVLKTNVHVHKKDIAVIDGKVVVNACGLIRMMYNTNDDDICYVEQDVAFTNEISVPEVKSDMKCDVSFKIGDVYEEIKENENGERKIIEVEIVVDILGKIFAKKNIQTLLDAYSPQERYDLERENVKALGFFGEGTDSQTIKERITLPEDNDPINIVKHVTANPLITDMKVVEDKVIAEGIVNCCIMYMKAVEEGGMASYEEDIPFKFSVDILGAKIEMMPEVIVNVEHISFDKISIKEVDVKVILECNAKTFHKTSFEIVKAVIEAELPENIKNMPSIIIYAVQHKDTLWKVAKRYGTTIEDIVQINELSDAESIEAGMKLIVPKKAFIK